MLLALDAGNSNITIGAFDGVKLISQWRLRTIREQTADEWGILLRNLFAPAGLDEANVDGIIISSVVPPIDATLAAMAERYFHTKAMFVTPQTDLGLKIRYDNPNEVGADRVVNGVAAFLQVRRPMRGRRSGHHHQLRCDLAPCASTWAAPSRSASASPSTRFSAKRRGCPWWISARPQDVVGTNTVASMQSGLYFGTIGAIDGILERIIAKLGPETKTIATGGQAHMIAGGSRYLKIVDEHLTLEGLRDDLGTQPAVTPDQDWVYNYFNYFTEIEEHFQRARGTGLFLLSPLDWALIESLEERGRAARSGAARHR